MYHHDVEFPFVTEDAELAHTPPLCFHVSCFSCDLEASLRPYPSQQVFEKLVDQYMVDGVCTSGEPLLITQPGKLQPWTSCPEFMGGRWRWCSPNASQPWVHKGNGADVYIDRHPYQGLVLSVTCMQ